MYSLVLDTATEHGVAGIFLNGKLVAKKEFRAGAFSNKTLLIAVDELTKEVGITRGQFSYIAAGVGPGSYTGIRVAVALAQGLSIGLRIPLVGVSSLKGFVPDSSQTGSFIAAIDAKIGGIYCLLGAMEDGVVSFHGQEELCALDLFEQRLKSVKYLVTPDIRPLSARFKEIPAQVLERGPALDILGKCADEEFCKGRGVLDGGLHLLYLRKTQAELELR